MKNTTGSGKRRKLVQNSLIVEIPPQSVLLQPDGNVVLRRPGRKLNIPILSLGLLLELFSHIEIEDYGDEYYEYDSEKPNNILPHIPPEKGPRCHNLFILAQVCRSWRLAAFKSHAGDSFHIRNMYASDEELLQGYTVFLQDPLRVACLRTLDLTQGRTAPLSVFQLVLRNVDVSKLQNVDLTSLQCGTQEETEETLNCIVDAFMQAPKPLRLKFLSITAEGDQQKVIPRLQQLLHTLKHAPLEEVDIDYIPTTECPFSHLSFDTIHRKLRKITITRNVILDDISTAAPNLYFLDLGQDSSLCLGAGQYPLSDFPPLPSLREINWISDGMYHLDTLPPHILSNLTSIGSYNAHGRFDLCLDRIESLLQLYPNITTFAHEYDMLSRPDVHWIDLEDLRRFLKNIKSKLKVLSVGVSDWDADLVALALREMPSLVEVQLTTGGDVYREDLAYIRAQTGIAELYLRRRDNMWVDLDEDNEEHWEEYFERARDNPLALRRPVGA
ncbi:hypothetical protein HDV00_006617 [Rhizophlyctis rosea]|nr:hypothetical protein HDV00_006617 [Rhizophlyctis rosea]